MPYLAHINVYDTDLRCETNPATGRCVQPLPCFLRFVDYTVPLPAMEAGGCGGGAARAMWVWGGLVLNRMSGRLGGPHSPIRTPINISPPINPPAENMSCPLMLRCRAVLCREHALPSH